MPTNPYTILTGDEGDQTALEMVNEAHDKFLGKADTRFEIAQQYAVNLANFHTTPTNWNVDLNFDPTALLQPFNRPTAPTLDTNDYNVQQFTTPGLPAEFDAREVDIGSLPEFTETAPVISLSPKPDQPTIDRPVAPLHPDLPDMPEEPVLPTPEEVQLIALNLPTVPNVTLPTYTSNLPTLEAFNLNDNFSNFTPQQYVSALLNKIESRVSTWMDGQEALPAAIEQALFARGRARIDVELQATEEQIHDDYGGRGFSQPSGLLAGRLDSARKDAQDKKAEFNRDAMLKSFDEALANMRLAVDKGLQLEGMKINLHIEMQRLELQSLQHLRDTAVALLNARIAHFNAQTAGVQLEVQVFEARLKAELSKLDLFRAQIDAEKAKGEINQQKVQLYTAQWEAVKTMVQMYSERVGAVKIQMEAAKLPIEIFSEETKAFEVMWSAYAKQIDGWKGEVEAENSKVLMYKTSADAYASRVDGVARMGALKMDKEKLRLSQHGMVLEQYGNALKRVDQLVRLEETRLNTVAARDRTLMDRFRAEADVEQVASASADRYANSLLAAHRARVDIELEEARIKSQENSQLYGLQLEAIKAMAQIMSQLAASTLSAVNYSASAGFSGSYSSGKHVSWSGEAPDYAGDI